MYSNNFQCAQRCIEHTDIVCRSFNYKAEEEKCVLFDVDKRVFGLVASSSVVYYERMSQTGNGLKNLSSRYNEIQFLKFDTFFLCVKFVLLYNMDTAYIFMTFFCI